MKVFLLILAVVIFLLDHFIAHGKGYVEGFKDRDLKEPGLFIPEVPESFWSENDN